MSVKITFLGGLGEIGRNCAAIEHDGKIALIDCGLMFPEADMLGVDLVFPNWEWLIERKQDVECVIGKWNLQVNRCRQNLGICRAERFKARTTNTHTS